MAGRELVTREKTTTVILSPAKDPRPRMSRTPARILRCAQDDGEESLEQFGNYNGYASMKPL
jgi:hypothetical protein